MSVMDEITKAMDSLPAIKTSEQYKEDIATYCEEPEDVATLFSLPFPRELVENFVRAVKSENIDRNRVLVHQVWQMVLEMPAAKVPINIRRRKLL